MGEAAGRPVVRRVAALQLSLPPVHQLGLCEVHGGAGQREAGRLDDLISFMVVAVCLDRPCSLLDIRSDQK
jgi:hypothetical protein